MADSKVIFFDIDGTLWNMYRSIPDSTRAAIKVLRQNGHKVFINSGRTRSFIQNKNLLSLGFDGIVAGCGTYIEMGEDIPKNLTIESGLLNDTIDALRSRGAAIILEGSEYLYFDLEEFAGDPYGDLVIADVGNRRKNITGNSDFSVNKLSINTRGNDMGTVIEDLSKDYEMLFHGHDVYEIVPKGYSKAVGIEEVCEIIGADIKDTFAFGDGRNDIEMLEKAGVGICMGSGTKEAKEAADYVTSEQYKDGIYHALRHFDLI
ncbi:MAG: Cof-type HAD-IIB family hydrolase [Eubacterium sp.]|nr:Cof-type HAD-IIB family hydrolase [Eubacterium sp.]